MATELYMGNGPQSERTGDSIIVTDTDTGEIASGIIEAYAGDGLLDVAGTDYWVRITSVWQ